MLPQITSRLRSWKTLFGAKVQPVPQVPVLTQRPSFWHLAQQPETSLPLFVRESAAALKYLSLLGALDWEHFPEREAGRAWPGAKPAPHAPLVGSLSGQTRQRAKVDEQTA